TVDVVIGTHRLLSKDVAFKHLGLLVVDEEHRFGVVHKERMKELRASVDVLALTATPIPRTLYMSLSGVRDMSVIETPPLDRLPVETIVRRFSKAVIKEALTRELERGGQVFFVHNRVQSLPSVTRFVQELVPEARVIMAHGQMKERELEATMVKFVSGQADVLVATAIVEPVISVAAEGFLPDAYVPEVNQRLAFYKRLAGAVSDPEVDDLRGELVDRFGPLPEEAEQLLDIVHLRVAARRLGVEKLEAGE